MIREFTVEDIKINDDIFVFMKRFENATKEIKVNVDYTRARYIDLVSKGIAKVFVDEVDGVFYGAIGFIVYNDFHSGEKCAVETFWFVPPEYSGIGSILVKAYEDAAKQLGCTKVAMVHLADSYPEKLKSYYKKIGYRLLESHYIKEI